MVSLLVSAGLTAFGNYLNSILPFGQLILTALNTVISVGLLSVLFAAIYKVLPDRHLEWADVMVGAVVTAILFTIGKSLIGWYIGSSAVASTYGAAGALMVLLLWVYYSAQISCSGRNLLRSTRGACAHCVSCSRIWKDLLCVRSINRAHGFVLRSPTLGSLAIAPLA
jgi:membrane protein